MSLFHGVPRWGSPEASRGRLLVAPEAEAGVHQPAGLCYNPAAMSTPVPQMPPGRYLVRAHSAALLALAGLALLFFGELLLHPGQVLYSDHSDLWAMHLPMKRFLVRSWQETGEVPLWNPYSFAGMPFVHDVQVAPFYPPHLPLYLLGEEWIGAGMSWLVVAHVLLAGWCMYAYALHQGLGPGGAFVAALGWMFPAKWLLHILAGGHTIMAPLAWLPLALLFQEQAMTRGSLVRATWAGAVFALLVVAAHPQMTFYAGLFLALWTLGPALERAGYLGAPASGTRLPAALARWAGLGGWTAAVAGGLAAIQLLPALEGAREASRAVGVTPEEILRTAGQTLRGLFGPGLHGILWESQGGLCVLWVLAAALAPLLFRGKVRFQAAVCVLLLLFALGGAAAVQPLPGFRLFQLPGRMLMLLAVPVALLAGWTTQALLGSVERSPAVRRRCLVVVCLLLAVIAAAVVGAGASVRAEGYSFLGHHYWLVLLASLPFFFWLLRPGAGALGRGMFALWVLLLIADLWAISYPLVAVRPEDAVYPVSACVRELVEARQGSVPERWRVLDRGLPGQPSSAPLGAALPMLGGIAIEPAQGYNSFDVYRYKQYLQYVTDDATPVRPREGLFGFPMLRLFPVCNKPLLDLLGVRYVLQPANPRGLPEADGEPTVNRRWRRLGEPDRHAAAYSFLVGGVQTLPPIVLYENLDVFPRAFVVPQAAPLPGPAAVLPALRTTDLRRTVLLEDAAPQQETTPQAGELRPAWIRDYTPNRIVLDVEGTTPGYLVLADIWFPGWTVTVDGQPQPVYRANYLFRATPVPAGKHEVVFRFEPVSYRIGQQVTLASLGLLAVLSLLALRRGRPSAL